MYKSLDYLTWKTVKTKQSMTSELDKQEEVDGHVA